MRAPPPASGRTTPRPPQIGLSTTRHPSARRGPSPKVRRHHRDTRPRPRRTTPPRGQTTRRRRHHTPQGMQPARSGHGQQATRVPAALHGQAPPVLDRGTRRRISTRRSDARQTGPRHAGGRLPPPTQETSALRRRGGIAQPVRPLVASAGPPPPVRPRPLRVHARQPANAMVARRSRSRDARAGCCAPVRAPTDARGHPTGRPPAMPHDDEDAHRVRATQATCADTPPDTRRWPTLRIAHRHPRLTAQTAARPHDTRRHPHHMQTSTPAIVRPCSCMTAVQDRGPIHAAISGATRTRDRRFFDKMPTGCFVF